MQKNECELGGIIKHNNGGYGYKTTFKTTQEAQNYKEMMMHILKSDDYQVLNLHGYYDKK